MNGRRVRAHPGLSVPVAAVLLAVSACGGGDGDDGGKDGDTSASEDGRVVVSSVADSDLDAMCEAIQAGVEEYAGSVEDVVDEVPDDRDERCYFARGNGLRNVATGMMRVHEFDADDVKAYEKAVREEDSEATECTAYWAVVNDADDQFNEGISEFGTADDSARPYCGGESDTSTVVSFTVPGAALVVELGATGELNGETADAIALRDAVLPDVFAAAPK